MKRLTALAVLALSVISSCGTGTEETSETKPPRITVIISTPAPTTTTTTIQPELNAHEALQEDLAETTGTTTTETPLVSDPLDYIDEQRMFHGKCGEWHDLALSVGWSESEWPTLSRILYRESRCTPLAFNGSDAGLVQINQIHTKWAGQMGMEWPDDLFDPENNLLFAYRLWSGREANGQCGWTPWSIDC
ncbi:LT_GEWL domain containing protein [uncultured Caudovirales phage]|uniref:LT_GEWL domain containing protein n=1 Tax=uncultured Caudovirales phage TaxID=2100421 RepID=A0A6J5T6Q8_9CAUD|nr:LT_GEWL domain containing protein [uncultured Caudovirales phage]CAB4176503.1 LT_GEWL domain containing protein [uncultured Caudovirales phage]CAB4191558.1 LT_GEWL domain containing protein [uncultured Caudovirales phage]CAB4223299.1 LT_GEWL domain containing protein [uncultured Caudovirales phage]CAB5220596.1 LT_GEWL domain containing protein [uncultured Caudovirales phage]